MDAPDPSRPRRGEGATPPTRSRRHRGSPNEGKEGVGVTRLIALPALAIHALPACLGCISAQCMYNAMSCLVYIIFYAFPSTTRHAYLGMYIHILSDNVCNVNFV